MTPGHCAQHKPLQLARGYFGRIEYHNGKLVVSGWMFLPARHFDAFALYVNQHKMGEVATIERPDVARVFPFISHASKSGFLFNVPIRSDEMEGMIDVCVVGLSKGREIAKIETWYRTDLYSCLPVPPSNLISRVVGNEDSGYYLLTGLHAYRELWVTLCRYAAPYSLKSMLDWGCGCGRVTSVFSKFSGIPRIYGCDIDAEAIAWCQDNLKPAEFSVAPPYPPTAYPDHAFDLIIAWSVFTHLSREVQFPWLKEIQRLLAPSGLFLATVHGDFAALFNFPGRNIREVLKDGICDDREDTTLDGIAPKGYYRGVFQTQEYTRREWSRYFEIPEYRDRGAANYQDLIVMKPRDQ